MPPARTEPLLNSNFAASSSTATSASSSNVLNEITTDNDATFIDRSKTAAADGGGCCSGLAQGSLWGTTFNMCAAILGAGVLSLPHAVAAMGIVPALVMLLFTAVATHYSVVLLVVTIGATGTKSFEDLTHTVFGPINGRLVELSIVVFQLGTLIAYTIAVGDILEPLTTLPAVKHAVGAWLTRDVVIVGFWAVLMLPLSFVERISALQFTSLFGVLSLCYLVVAVAVHFAADAAVTPAKTFRAAALVKGSVDAVSASAVILYAFTCQVNVPALYEDLADRSPAAMGAVSKRAVLLCLTFYLVAGLCGYADFPESHEGNLLKNYCLLDAGKSSATPTPPRVMPAAFCAITLTITMAYPINVFPTRYALEMMCFGSGGGGVRSSVSPRQKCLRHVVLTLLITGSTLAAALLFKDISVVFRLMGGTASAYVCYMIPAAAAWKLRERIPLVGNTAMGKAKCLALFFYGLLVGVLSTSTTIAGLFEPAANLTSACDSSWAGTHSGGDEPGSGGYELPADGSWASLFG